MSGVRNGQYTRTEGLAPGAKDPTQPRFHTEAIEDQAATAAQGRPIYRSEERVQILLPGGFNSPVFRVTDEHKERWPDHYAAFRRGEDMAIDGTPLEQWPVLKRAQVYELKALNVHTVEQCAAMPDSVLHRVGMAAQKIRELAQAYLNEAEATALLTKITRDNDAKDAEISSLKRQVAEQGELLNRVSDRLTALQNLPHPTATALPSAVDPFEALRQAGGQQQPAVTSALEALPAPRRGRPPKHLGEGATPQLGEGA